MKFKYGDFFPCKIKDSCALRAECLAVAALPEAHNSTDTHLCLNRSNAADEQLFRGVSVSSLCASPPVCTKSSAVSGFNDAQSFFCRSKSAQPITKPANGEAPEIRNLLGSFQRFPLCVPRRAVLAPHLELGYQMFLCDKM